MHKSASHVAPLIKSVNPANKYALPPVPGPRPGSFLLGLKVSDEHIAVAEELTQICFITCIWVSIVLPWILRVS